MPIGEILTKYAWTIASDKAKEVLGKMWREAFPPTPLYIAALDAATKELQSFWEHEEHARLPQLDIAEAMRRFDWKYLDKTKIEDLPLASKTQVENALLPLVAGVGGDEAKQFVGRVVELADQKFKIALTFENKEAGSLWKQSITLFADSQKQTQAEILKKLSDVEQLLRVFLTRAQDPNNRVYTIDEVLGTEDNIKRGELTQPLPPPSSSLSLSRINIAEFWQSYNNAWYKWWDASSQAESFDTDLRVLRKKAAVAPLSEPDNDRMINLGKKFEQAVADLAQAKADLTELEKYAPKLFQTAD